MKKAIILVLMTFLVFVIFLSSKSANAELTPVAPFYGGDIFNGQELYLFQNYSATPNFQNGYISKQTITNQDVYYQENSYYNGWYKNLGEDLIYDYTGFPEQEVENPYFWFYITFNGLLAQYFQFALIAPEPFEGDYYIKFKNENPINFLTTNRYNDYLVTPPTTDMTKEIEWFCFEVYFPDYMASFRPLTAQIAYDFGFSAGEMSGFDRGHNVGYNTGYQNGLQDAMEQGAEVKYVQIQQYNQLIQGRNEQTTNNDVTFTFYDNGIIRLHGTATANANYRVSYLNNIGQHIYYMFGSPNNSTNDNFYLQDNYNGQIATSNGYRGPFASDNREISIFLRVKNGTNTNGVYFIPKVIDLTEMYGEGREPSLEQCHEIFDNMGYYPYNTGIIANVGYYNGYSDGYYEGIETGKNIQATTQLTSTGWMTNIFEGIGAFLGIQILPGVTIGLIVGIPFIISLAYFVIRAFRGGGGA